MDDRKRIKRDLFPVRKLSHSDNLVTAFVIASNPKDFPISDSPKGTVSPRISASPPLTPSLRNSNRITRPSLSSYFSLIPPPSPPHSSPPSAKWFFFSRSVETRSSRNNGRINRRKCGRHFVSLLDDEWRSVGDRSPCHEPLSPFDSLNYIRINPDRARFERCRNFSTRPAHRTLVDTLVRGAGRGGGGGGGFW